MPEIVGVTFRAEGLFDLLDGPPETALFGPGSGYARHRGPDAVHFLADPLCANPAYGRGYNYLDAEARRGTSYPVAEIHVDSASRDCAAEGRWPLEADLMGLVSPLYVVVRVDGRMERLVLRFVGV